MLKDETKRSDYDALLASVPPAWRPRYGETKLEATPVLIAVSSFLVVLISLGQISTHRFRRARERNHAIYRAAFKERVTLGGMDPDAFDTDYFANFPGIRQLLITQVLLLPLAPYFIYHWWDRTSSARARREATRRREEERARAELAEKEKRDEAAREAKDVERTLLAQREAEERAARHAAKRAERLGRLTDAQRDFLAAKGITQLADGVRDDKKFDLAMNEWDKAREREREALRIQREEEEMAALLAGADASDGEPDLYAGESSGDGPDAVAVDEAAARAIEEEYKAVEDAKRKKKAEAKAAKMEKAARAKALNEERKRLKKK